MSVDFRDSVLWKLLQATLGSHSAEAEPPCPLIFRDGSLLSPLDTPLTISLSDYQGAIDRRDVRLVNMVTGTHAAFATITVHGRQVGTLGSIIATGRAFSSLVNVELRGNPRSPEGVFLEFALLDTLARSGISMKLESCDLRPLLYARATDRSDLLTGSPEATYWARSWSLPPRLARLAVLLMGGCSLSAISQRLKLSIRSVRTYTEQLFARAGIQSRSQLPLAALRDGGTLSKCAATTSRVLRSSSHRRAAPSARLISEGTRSGKDDRT